ncbi:hypothetical protein [Burkholderia sp. BCC1993]|uniref:hypothetical protein n=1 Tax=Burkholderia sp. BCC1993 TaxID=2817444 RepID=UPI002AB0CE20|nr:hypothetical protein [Burkholderia sp. BCC1993]
MQSTSFDLDTIQKARAQTDEFLRNLTDTAAAQGVALVARGSVVPVSQFPDWPTKLAEALCEDPSLAEKSNAELVSVIETRSGKSGFNPKLLSKTLSNLQRSYASDVLLRYGYASTSLVKGTDIKRIVRDRVRVDTPEALEAVTTEVKTTFFADGISIDGRNYQYRQRQTTPAGNPWYDFCIRIGGSDTPLRTVLVLRGVGIGEFRNKDEAAIAAATPKQAQRRKELDREPQQHRGVPRF